MMQLLDLALMSGTLDGPPLPESVELSRFLFLWWSLHVRFVMSCHYL